jgi:toxin YoeB
MAQLTIHWTETAVRQRNFIFEYWIQRNQSVTYAKKLNEKIRERTNLLKQNPELGVKTTFKNTRAVSLGHL